MGGRGGVHHDKPLRVGGVAGAWWWQPESPGRKRGVAPSTTKNGVRMFELAQLNVFTRDVKKGGGG